MVWIHPFPNSSVSSSNLAKIGSLRFGKRAEPYQPLNNNPNLVSTNQPFNDYVYCKFNFMNLRKAVDMLMNRSKQHAATLEAFQDFLDTHPTVGQQTVITELKAEDGFVTFKTYGENRVCQFDMNIPGTVYSDFKNPVSLQYALDYIIPEQGQLGVFRNLQAFLNHNPDFKRLKVTHLSESTEDTASFVTSSGTLWTYDALQADSQQIYNIVHRYVMPISLYQSVRSINQAWGLPVLQNLEDAFQSDFPISRKLKVKALRGCTDKSVSFLLSTKKPQSFHFFDRGDVTHIPHEKGITLDLIDYGKLGKGYYYTEAVVLNTEPGDKALAAVKAKLKEKSYNYKEITLDDIGSPNGKDFFLINRAKLQKTKYASVKYRFGFE